MPDLALEQLVLGITHIELETTPDFFEIFVEGCMLKTMPDGLGGRDSSVGRGTTATRRPA